MTDFTFSSYERALCLLTFFPISGLARPGVKLRLWRCSWRAFASTHPLMLPSTSPREALFACPPVLFGFCLPSFTEESTLSSSCSRSDPSSLAKVRLSLALILSLLSIWCFGQTVLFLLAKTALVYLPTALFVTLKPLFSAGPVRLSFSAKACAILQALCWSRKHQQVCHFSSLLLLSDSGSVLTTLSSPPSFLLPQSL